MAFKDRIKTDSKGRKYIIVIKGDTLSEIAESYFGDYTKYKTLAAIPDNNIVNPDLICVGQKIYLEDSSSSSGSKASDPNRVTIKQFGLDCYQDNVLFVTWNFSNSSKTDHYEVEWRYKTIIWQYSKTTTEYMYSTYNIPSGARYVDVRIKPVPKTKKEGDKEEPLYKNATWTARKEHKVGVSIDIPTGLSASIDGTEITASLSNLQDEVTLVQFEILKDNATTISSGSVGVSNTKVSWKKTVAAGSVYNVRCRAYGGGVWSEWSDYSGDLKTVPANVTKLTSCVAKSESSIYLEWGSATGAETYEIHHHTDRSKLEEENGHGSITGIKNSYRTVDDLESGQEYFFRVRACNSVGESEWSEISSVIIGTGPIAPTTWSSTTTAIVGEPLNLYWVHNTEDGSSQTYAEVEMSISNVDNIVGVTFKEFVATTTEVTVTNGRAVVNAFVTATGEQVYFGTMKDDKDADVGVYYHIAGNGKYYQVTYTTYASTEIGTISRVEFGEDSNTIIYRIDNSTKDNEIDKTHSLTIDTSMYTEGASITWRARTAGITGVEGEWSGDRIVDIYNIPIATIKVTDSNEDSVGRTYYLVETVTDVSGTVLYVNSGETIESVSGAPLTGTYTVSGEQVRLGTGEDGSEIYYCIIENSELGSYPFTVTVSVEDINTNVQYPISYHLSVTSNEIYDTVDNVGNPKTVNVGESLYSKHFSHPYNSLEPLEVTLSASDITLEGDRSYTVVCVVSLSSGLTVETSTEIDIAWQNVYYQPNMEINIDTDSYSAHIRPYCISHRTTYYKVETVSTQYVKTDEVLNTGLYGEIMTNVVTVTGEQVYDGMTAAGTAVYYCIIEEDIAFENVTLSVYRREYDGSFTEIATKIPGTGDTYVTDPHPALDYARYRIIATDNTTGTISYYDAASYPVGGKAVIIQWDEAWTSFDATGEAETLDQPPWSGSLLQLPYNIDVADKYSQDVSLIEYIGRKHPVSYYGTQLGETSTWNMVIPKSDKDTLYALRRLSTWTGNAYVREPSGSGYWASVNVSFSQKHKDVTIPITLDITRVEGGI